MHNFAHLNFLVLMLIFCLFILDSKGMDCISIFYNLFKGSIEVLNIVGLPVVFTTHTFITLYYIIEKATKPKLK